MYHFHNIFVRAGWVLMLSVSENDSHIFFFYRTDIIFMMLRNRYTLSEAHEAAPGLLYHKLCLEQWKSVLHGKRRVLPKETAVLPTYSKELGKRNTFKYS